MSMELLASPYLKKPDGYYTADEARSAQIEHLEDILFSLPHIASVDAFQSWIYTSGQGHNAAARDRAWLDIRSRFERGVDWSGLDQQRVVARLVGTTARAGFTASALMPGDPGQTKITGVVLSPSSPTPNFDVQADPLSAPERTILMFYNWCHTSD